jgi:hypothetical protein
METCPLRTSITATEKESLVFPGRDFLWTNSNLWSADAVVAFYRRRDREVMVDPVCLNISYYRRTGKFARFEFLCTLRCQNIKEDHGICIWLSFLDVQSSPSTRDMLNKKKWRMSEHYSHYTDGEDIWDEDGDSCDENYRLRMARRGFPRKITTTAARRKPPRKRPRI